MEKFPFQIGDKAIFSKTVSESDIYLFAGISGDFARNHIDEAYMKNSAYGRRIAHGALLIGYMSTTSTRILDKVDLNKIDRVPVSLGYDRIRFLKPVFINDTVTIQYVIHEIDPERHRSVSKIEMTNQNGELVAIADHILKWVPHQT
jgi:acyl dehydratase